MKHIALIGASGHVGSALFKELRKDTSLRVEAVIRKNYLYWKKHTFDIVINAAMPSARFWAEGNPYEDFVETVRKTADIVYDWKYKKFIQISTISARTERDGVYGRHKAAAETICNFGENLIVRLTAIYADTLSKGALIDIINEKKVYVHEKSRYAFADLAFVCQWIAQHLDRKGLVEVGAKNTISLDNIVKYLKLSVEFEGRIDIQEVQNPSHDFPDAREVLSYLEKRMKKESGVIHE